MRLRTTHTLCVNSLASVYAPNEVREFHVKEAFYAQLQMVMNSCAEGDTLIVLGEFNATTGTDMMAMSHVLVPTALAQEMKAPQCSLTLLFDQCSLRLRIAGSWFQRPALHH